MVRFSGKVMLGAAALLSSCRTARADDKAVKLLEEAAAKMSSLKTLTANLSETQSIDGHATSSRGTVKLRKPNLALIVFKGSGFSTTISASGSGVITLMSNNEYFKEPSDAKGRNVNRTSAYPISYFFDPQRLTREIRELAPAYRGRETVGGTTYDVVGMTRGTQTIKLYLRQDKLITRSTITLKQEQRQFVLASELTNVRLNAPLRAADLAFTLPKTAKLYKEPDYNAKLIPVGKLAEKFDLVALKEDHITFDDAARGKKAVLVNFWFYG